MPIFWRILLTNLFVVLGGAVVGTYFTQRFVQRGEFTVAMHLGMIGVAIVLSGVITWIGVRSVSEQLARKNAIIAEQNRRLTALTQQVISAQEDERKRIARELHDEAGQALTALIIGLERGEQAMPGEHLAKPRETVARLRDLAVATLEEIRNLAHDLRPSLLDDLGLAAALQWYARSCSARGNLAVDVAIEGLDEGERLGPEVETAVFRIVQEGLTNVLKHARARHAWIRLRRDAAGLAVDVEDDGVGIAPFQVGGTGRSDHLGLFGMVERAKLLGGSMEIGPRPGGGTKLRLTVPLPLRGDGQAPGGAQERPGSIPRPTQVRPRRGTLPKGEAGRGRPLCAGERTPV
jgi:signal transduction histidine kinase